MPLAVEGVTRTTIEIRDRQRARLLELAARRGEKGFSKLVQEAIDLYLSREVERQDRVRRALSVLGTLSDEDAEAMRESVRWSRSHWR